MKRIIITFYLFCSLSFLYAQNLISIGQKIDGSDLKAECFHFNENIQTFSIDPSFKYLCLKFRELTKNGKYWKNKGLIGLYDIKEHKLLWKNSINYATSNSFCTNTGVMIYSTTNSIFYDIKTGHIIWKNDIYPAYINDSLNIVVGYKNAYSSKLYAATLDKGIPLWETKISHEYGWNNNYKLSPTKRLIIADNIHCLNLLTGENLTYNIQSGGPNMKGLLLQGIVMMAGAMAGAAVSGGGYYGTYVPMSGKNVITDMVSNVIEKNSCFYIADRKNIMCLDSLLNPIWKHEISNKMASHSSLIFNKGRLFMLNYGYGRVNGGSLTSKGLPFIAEFDSKTGKEISFNLFSDKKEIIKDAVITNNSFYILFNNRLTYQNIHDSIVNSKEWDVTKYGNLIRLLPDTLYIFNPEQETFKPISFDGTNCLVYSDQHQAYLVDTNLNIKANYSNNLIYIPEIRLKDYFCVRKNNDFWFIHKLGLPIAHFQIDLQRGVAVGNKLLMLTANNDLIYLDLDEAIN